MLPREPCIQSTGQRDHMTVTAVRASKTVGGEVYKGRRGCESIETAMSNGDIAACFEFWDNGSDDDNAGDNTTDPPSSRASGPELLILPSRPNQQGAPNRQNSQTIRDIISNAKIGIFEIDLSLGTLAEVNEEVKYFNDHVDECRVCEFDEEVDGDTLCIEGLKYWVGGIDCGCDEMCAEDPVVLCDQCQDACCINGCVGGSECEVCKEYFCDRCNSKHQCAGGGGAPPAVAAGGGAGANARAARKRKAPVASDADDVAVKLLDSTPRVRRKLR